MATEKLLECEKKGEDNKIPQITPCNILRFFMEVSSLVQGVTSLCLVVTHTAKTLMGTGNNAENGSGVMSWLKGIFIRDHALNISYQRIMENNWLRAGGSFTGELHKKTYRKYAKLTPFIDLLCLYSIVSLLYEYHKRVLLLKMKDVG